MKFLEKFRKAKDTPAANTAVLPAPEEDYWQKRFNDACKAAGLPMDRNLAGEDLQTLMDIANRLTVERERSKQKSLRP